MQLKARAGPVGACFAFSSERVVKCIARIRLLTACPLVLLGVEVSALGQTRQITTSSLRSWAQEIRWGYSDCINDTKRKQE